MIFILIVQDIYLPPFEVDAFRRHMNLMKLFEELSPVLIEPKPTSIKVSLSKRFLIFQILQELGKKIEDDPYLNFISVLENYKVFSELLHDHIKELLRDKNKFYDTYELEINDKRIRVYFNVTNFIGKW